MESAIQAVLDPKSPEAYRNIVRRLTDLKVTLHDLPKLLLMYPALKLMFAEHYEEMELKAFKRQLKQERESARLPS